MSIPTQVTEARAPNHGPAFWRRHINLIQLGKAKLTLPRVFPDGQSETDVRRDMLLGDIAAFLDKMSSQSARPQQQRPSRTSKRAKSHPIPKGTFQRIQKEFTDKWHCDQEWLNTTKGLTAHFGYVPAKADLVDLIGEADSQ